MGCWLHRCPTYLPVPTPVLLVLVDQLKVNVPEPPVAVVASVSAACVPPLQVVSIATVGAVAKTGVGTTVTVAVDSEPAQALPLYVNVGVMLYVPVPTAVLETARMGSKELVVPVHPLLGYTTQGTCRPCMVTSAVGVACVAKVITGPTPVKLLVLTKR